LYADGTANGANDPYTLWEITMKRTSQILFSLVNVIGAVVCTEVRAEPATSEPLGEHPAIVARRVIANAGYDYASKMYRHPAGLTLYLEQPREMGDHPAVLVARTWNKRNHDDLARITSHPALSRFAAAQSVQANSVPDDSPVTVAKAAQ
jgi:hypothetical protein